VVEELMSIADGQVVLQRDMSSGQVTVDPQTSVSRIGTRAYAPALSDLAVQLRFDLAQARVFPMGIPSSPALLLCTHGAVDETGCLAQSGDASPEGRLACSGGQTLSRRSHANVQAVDAARFTNDPQGTAVREQASFAEQTRAALAQTPGHPVPLEEQASAHAHSPSLFRSFSVCNNLQMPGLWSLP
jgi:hypothetical protein